jgi:hypothetical protein
VQTALRARIFAFVHAQCVLFALLTNFEHELMHLTKVEMTEKWELCYVRPPVVAGMEVVFFHPLVALNERYRTAKEFLDTRDIIIPLGTDPVQLTVSTLLSDGWEPLSIGGAIGDWRGHHPHFGATGYAFRRRCSSS